MGKQRRLFPGDGPEPCYLSSGDHAYEEEVKLSRRFRHPDCRLSSGFGLYGDGLAKKVGPTAGPLAEALVSERAFCSESKSTGAE